MKLFKKHLIPLVILCMLMSGIAACDDPVSPTEQTSILSPLPSPTPTAFVPPTLTPPNFRAWPTPIPSPVPTPLPTLVAQAQKVVAQQEGIPADQLNYTWVEILLHPVTGEELSSISFRSKLDRTLYRVHADSTGHLVYPPDYSEQAIALVAEQTGIPAERLSVVETGSFVYPITRQFEWYAQVAESEDEEGRKVCFDLVGNPVDIDELRDAESAALQAECPKISSSLCTDLLYGPAKDMHYVQIFMPDEPDVDRVLHQVGVADYEYDSGGRRVSTWLSKEQIFELSALDAVRNINRDQPGKMTPLDDDNRLRFTFEEVGGDVTLKVWTEIWYLCPTNPVVAELVSPGPQQLEIVIEGIFLLPGCTSRLGGPATWQVDLGQMSGSYDLTFVYEDWSDRYQLTVSPERITLEPEGEEFFLWPQYQTWLHLPPDTVWFVIQARMKGPGRVDLTPTRSTYESEVKQFVADLESLGAEPFSPQPGFYSNRWIAPPWPDWWQGEDIQVRLDESRFYVLNESEISYYCLWQYCGRWSGVLKASGLPSTTGPESTYTYSIYHFKWPKIAYYHYDGSDEQLRQLIQRYSSTITVMTYTWDGEFLYFGE